MNVSHEEALMKKCCMDISKFCKGSECMGWIWDKMTEFDSDKKEYITYNLVTGHCGHVEYDD